VARFPSRWTQHGSRRRFVVRYADDYEKGHNAKIFDQHFRNIEGHAASSPFMCVAGNHEAQYQFAGFRNRLLMPKMRSASAAMAPFYYSFDYGPVHFVVYSSEHTFANGSVCRPSLSRSIVRSVRFLTTWRVQDGCSTWFMFTWFMPNVVHTPRGSCGRSFALWIGWYGPLLFGLVSTFPRSLVCLAPSFALWIVWHVPSLFEVFGTFLRSLDCLAPSFALWIVWSRVETSTCAALMVVILLAPYFV
jgi:hypothetical protein